MAACILFWAGLGWWVATMAVQWISAWLGRWRRPADHAAAADAFQACVAEFAQRAGATAATVDVAPWRAFGPGWSDAMQTALDQAELALAESPYLAGSTFSLADIHWMPYIEYLTRIGEGEPVLRRKNLAAWWQRVSNREAWQRVARTGPQPYDPGMTADVVEKQYRR